jgi:serine protease Do
LFVAGCAVAQEPRLPAKPTPSRTGVLKELSSSFEDISDHAGRAVVQIFVRSYVAAEATSSDDDVLTAQNSSGSGIILSPDGYILTNAHVVKNAHSVKVRLNIRTEAESGRTADRALAGTLIGIDHDSDLAVIKIDRKNLPYLEFGDSDALRQGQLVLALGNPLGLDNSVSLGVISALARQVKPEDPITYIQTDAPINPGNSGGPLLDSDGRVVGVNTFILTQSGGSEGIGFAVPSSVAREVYQQLKAQGHVHRAQLGLIGQTITPDLAEGLDLQAGRGVLISDLKPGGAAEHGGLQVDDIVIGLDGKRVNTMQEFESSIFRLQPGAKVTLTVQRGESKLELPVISEEREGSELDALADLVDPVKNMVPQLGIVGLDITKDVLKLMPDLRRPAGVVVAARKAPAPYSGAPLQTGDAIYSVNRKIISNVQELRSTLSGYHAGQAIVLQVERDGRLIYVPLELE